jgi:hypothetical protein
MEAICSSKTLVDFYWTMWPYIPEDGIPESHCCENLKSNNQFNWNSSSSIRMELTSAACVPLSLCAKRMHVELNCACN